MDHPMLRRLICMTAIASALAAAGGRTVHFYVSPSGNDVWTGTLPAANASHTDGPFRTFEAARDATRKFRSTGSPNAGVVVEIRGGRYDLFTPLIFTAADSGTSSATVVWRALKNEDVRITGGKTVRGFRRVTDLSVVKRLPPSARAHVVVADLGEEGIRDYGEIVPRGGPPMELFYGGKRMQVARYPNSGWLMIEDVPQTGDSLYNKGLEREKRFNGVPAGRHYGRITYNGTRPASWGAANDIFLHGYWTFDWSDTYQRVGAIDTARREITLVPPHHHYGYTKGQRYYALNILEELDAPGEWYLDRTNGLLYFWPPSSLRMGQVMVSLRQEPLVRIDSCAWISVEGLKFEYTRGPGIVMTEAHNVLVDRCTFRNLGKEGVIIDGGYANSVRKSEIHDTGLGGIILRGGDRKTLTPAHHVAEGNHIHHYSTWLRTGQYAVVMDGVGHRIAHNHFHDSPFEGVYVKGNDHLIEYNEFDHLMKETGDAGAIHTGRNWTWRGNVIRYNYFHDLKGPGLHGVMGVYLDDWASGFTVTGNLFYRAGRATMIGGGRDNVVENNVYVECSPSLHVDARGLGWASYYLDGRENELFTTLEAMNYKQPPYSVRYPELLKQLDGEPAIPKYNRIVGNVSYGGRWMDVYDYLVFDFSVVTVKDNIIGDPVVLRRRKDGEQGWDPYYLNIDMKEGYVALRQDDPGVKELFRGNTFVKGNPGVLAPAAGDFRFRKGSVAKKPGFTPVPLRKLRSH
jgi:hypothetical protein